MTSERVVTRAGIIGTLLALLVAAVCVRLGIWQLDRLDQRRERNAAVAERMQASPRPLLGPVADTTGLLYRRVAVSGELDHARSVVLRGRSYRGSPGVHLITPLRLARGRGVVLVNRGWLPSADAATVDLAPYAEPVTIELTGLATPFPVDSESSSSPDAVALDVSDGGSAVLQRLDAGALRRLLPYPILDVYVQALPDDEAAAELPARLEPPDLDEGPHLGYAVQWFGFAAVALFGWGIVAIRRGTAEQREEGDGPGPPAAASR